MINLSPYCELVDAKIRASDKDLPVHSKQKIDVIGKCDLSFGAEVQLNLHQTDVNSVSK